MPGAMEQQQKHSGPLRQANAAMLFLLPMVALHWASHYLTGCVSWQMDLNLAVHFLAHICTAGASWLTQRWVLATQAQESQRKTRLQRTELVLQQREQVLSQLLQLRDLLMHLEAE